MFYEISVITMTKADKNTVTNMIAIKKIALSSLMFRSSILVME
jgi:hypothetical protein